MRILHASDFHGSTRVWRKWIDLIVQTDPDYAVYGGDISGKLLVPVVRQGNSHATANYFGRVWDLEGDVAIDEFLQRLEAAGVYGALVDDETVAAWKATPDLAIDELNHRIAQRLDRWLEMGRPSLDRTRTTLLVMAGNDDESYVDDVIDAHASERLIRPVGKVIAVDGLEMVSLDISNKTPWNTPREYDDSTVGQRVASELGRLQRPERSIFNFHCPPMDTRIDLAPKLDRSLKPVLRGGELVMAHVGSKQTRRHIESFQPLLTLHGHIHESPGVDRIGRTTCVNPGSEYGEGILRALTIDVTTDGVRNVGRLEQ